MSQCKEGQATGNWIHCHEETKKYNFLSPADVYEDPEREGKAGDGGGELVLLGEAGQRHWEGGDGGGRAKVDQQRLRHVQEECGRVGPGDTSLVLALAGLT